MPRIVARRPDGTLLVAVGHAGLIVHPDGYIPVIRENMRISMVYSLFARPGWEEVNEPVPEGLLTQEHIAAMREFDKQQMEKASPRERRRLERYRLDTGDD
ncbi:hypothetical protein [Actinomadura alba]|uniref:Uncharacterized protein n=1 Tax=Actinomadura alba TaxID=406431 RepID=A0ABR7LXI4_9ACTN|nr:hypothetical protein [Actinomadura alba]MBC6469165.1 hypothetical protein [Actinomadura alba]